MEKIVLIRESNYMNSLDPIKATTGELSAISELANGISLPLGQPLHKVGCYGRVVGEYKTEGSTYLGLVTFPFSDLNPTESYPSSFVVIKDDYVGYVTETGAELSKRIDGIMIKKSTAKTIIEESFEAAFPGLWEAADDSSQEIIVHFPKITISNKNKSTHEINDMFVRFGFTSNLKNMMVPRATRTTRSIDEVIVGYIHSHLSTVYHGYGDFCFGDTAIARTLEDLRVSEITKDKLTGFLLQFDDYIHWESLEGGPYFKIEDLGKPDLRRAIRQQVSNSHSNDCHAPALEDYKYSIIPYIAKKLLDELTPADLRFNPGLPGMYAKPSAEVDLDSVTLMSKLSKITSVASSEISVHLKRSFNISKGKYHVAGSIRSSDDLGPRSNIIGVREYIGSRCIVFKGKTYLNTVTPSNKEGEGTENVLVDMLPAWYVHKTILQVNSWLSQENLVN